jgi:hypothetical protein
MEVGEIRVINIVQIYLAMNVDDLMAYVRAACLDIGEICADKNVMFHVNVATKLTVPVCLVPKRE